MTELRMFYRMLGIAENIIEPSFYHLLGIDRKNCTPENVRAALLARKNELRQNAPGPEFIPKITEFEKEHLEPAAEVLANEKRRKKYDQVIAARWQMFKHEMDKRANLVGAVRHAVSNAIDSNGTLDKAGKEALGRKLRGLGVEEHNVDAILARIPAPLYETGENSSTNLEFLADSVGLAADEGKLDDKEKTRLYELADRLNIDKDTAGETIDGPLVKDGFRIQERYLDEEGKSGKPVDEESGSDAEETDEEGDAGKIRLMNDVLEDEKKEEEIENAVNESEAAYEEMERRWKLEDQKSGNGLLYISIVVLLIVLGVAAYLFMNKNGGGEGVDGEVVKPGEVLHEEPLTEELRKRPVEIVKPEPVEPVWPDRKPVFEPVDGSGGDVIDDEPAVSGDSEVKAVSGQLSDAAKLLVLKNFMSLSRDEVLSDTVTAMAGLCSRASELGWQSQLWNTELYEMVDAPNPAELIAERVVFINDGRGGLDDEVYAELKKGLSSGAKHVRDYAIERLQEDGSRRAVEILLGESGLPGSNQTVSRKLRALSQINESYIAGELAKRIGETSRGVTAHYICLSLIDMTGIMPKREGALAGLNDFKQRKASADWWVEAVEGWERNESAGEEGPVDGKLFEQVIRPGKLVAAAAYYCDAAAGELAVIGSGLESAEMRRRPAVGKKDKINAVWDSEISLANAAVKFTVQLEKAVRKLDIVGEFTSKVDLLCSGTERGSAGMNGFKAVESELAASGGMLEILVGLFYPDGRFDAEIGKIRSDREADLQRSVNVVQKMRQHAMYNLILFDLVLQEIENAEIKIDDPVIMANTVNVKDRSFSLGEKMRKARKDKMRAFGNLAVGLDAYLKGRLDIAEGYLKKSVEYGEGEYVMDIFHARYSGLLDTVIADCNSGAELVCKVCGGKEIADCSKCSGSGWDLCRECRGTGVIEVGRRSGICKVCEGLGAVKCLKCGGEGVVGCSRIGDEDVVHGPWISELDKYKVEQILAIAKYLGRGGADFYSRSD